MRVLDLTQGVAGPHATKLLADHGVAVTKLEPPGGDRARAPRGRSRAIARTRRRARRSSGCTRTSAA
ncbi:MAG: CoA transferase [Chloroflexi bacterium]|nr:CoA transferase [Chloroflexota bacterium]MDA1002771.1 CoA transferase [Chloroflexota bacterium]